MYELYLLLWMYISFLFRWNGLLEASREELELTDTDEKMKNTG